MPVGIDFRVALVVSAVCVAAGQRALALPGYDVLDVLLGLGLTASVWGWMCALDQVVCRRAPRSVAVAVSVALASVFYLSLCAELAYTYFYSAAESRELSLLSIGVWEGLRVLFAELLPPRGLLQLGALFAVAHLAGLMWTRVAPRRWRLRWPAASGALAGLTLVVLITGAKTQERIRSPIADLAREVVFLATTPKLDLDHAPGLPFDAHALDKAVPDDPAQAYAFDNVLVFVMETMITRDFDAERGRLPSETFLNRAAAQVHRYTDYHGNNQDSRTGMLDMLQSRVIPYEAYAHGVDRYEFLSRLPSLIDRFNTRGYETAYAASHADREAVLADLAWKQVLLLPMAEVDRLGSELLCVTRYEFEYGCEDRAILPKIFALLDQHEKVFLFQEFIWGHDPDYNEISGRSNADYYSTYLDAVIEHLRTTGKLDRTLIVLTSDHGYRGQSSLGETFAYHLPLWFYATRFDAREDKRLFSHIDFRDLLLYELGAQATPQRADPFVPVIGPTGISSLTILDAAGELVLIRTRGNSHFVLAHRSAPGRSQMKLNPASFARLLRDYRKRFDALAGLTAGNGASRAGAERAELED